MVLMAEHLRISRFEDHLADDLPDPTFQLEQVVDPLPRVLLSHSPAGEEQKTMRVERQDDVPI